MKKLLFLLLITLATNGHSQNTNDDLYGLYAKESVAKLYKDQAEAYLNKSTNYQYGALGCASVSAGLLIGYGSMSEKFELNDKGKTKLTGKAKGLLIGGGIIGIVAVILEVNAIQCKVNARKSFRLQSGESGAGLAFVF